MKPLQKLLVLSLLLTSASAFADAGLSDQLNDLKVPENTAPVALRSERLYSVQARNTELAHRFEFDLGGAKNFTGNGLLNQTQIDAAIRYHLTNRWDVSVSGAYGYNSFTGSANTLFANSQTMLQL
jgi:hypothetical protein